jgi:hypothetical protein
MSKVIELTEGKWDEIRRKVIKKLPLDLVFFTLPAFSELHRELFGEKEIEQCDKCVYSMVSYASEPCVSCKHNDGEKNNFRKES